MSEVILEAKNVFLSFHGVAALTNVSFEVRKGEIFSIIGPNGAGKTCMMNCINGLYRSETRPVVFQGNRHHALLSASTCSHGLVPHVSKNRAVRRHDCLGQYPPWPPPAPSFRHFEFLHLLGEDFQGRDRRLGNSSKKRLSTFSKSKPSATRLPACSLMACKSA